MTQHTSALALQRFQNALKGYRSLPFPQPFKYRVEKLSFQQLLSIMRWLKTNGYQTNLLPQVSLTYPAWGYVVTEPIRWLEVQW